MNTLEDIRQLSVPDRIQLVEDIWDSIAETPQELDLTQAQKDELDRRLQSYEDDPAAGKSWEQVKAQARATHLS